MTNYRVSRDDQLFRIARDSPVATAFRGSLTVPGQLVPESDPGTVTGQSQAAWSVVASGPTSYEMYHGRNDGNRKAGFEVQRITAETLRRPRELVEDVHALLVKAGYDGPGPVFSPDWMAHFAPG